MKKEERHLIVNEIARAVSIIIDEDNWCKRAMARNKNQEQLYDPKDDNAYSFCIYGVLFFLDSSPDTITYLQQMAKSLGWSDLDRLNDMNDHHYVIQFLQDSMRNLGGMFRLKYVLSFVKEKK
jgi:hypothetical protein